MRNKKTIIAVVCLCFFIAAGFLVSEIMFANKVSAGASQNVSGWVWSDNIGWVSFNNSSSGGTNNYGANIEESGNITGYAWSGNLGWIQFNPSGPYPASPNYSAKVDTTTGAITGWAKGLTTDNNWDGWIKMNGVNIDILTGKFSGYAWGGSVIGWLKFSGPSYQAQTSFSFNHAPTVDGLSVNQGDYCSYPLHPTLYWTFHDADSGDFQDSYNVQIDDDTNIADAPLADSCLPSPGTCSTGHNSQSYSPLNSFAYGVTYYWRVRVADNHGKWSDSWSAASSFTTPPHAFPNPNFDTVSKKITKNEFAQFCATKQTGTCPQDLSECYNSAGKVISCSGKTFAWAFPSGTEFSTTTSSTSENPKVKFASTGAQTVSLRITDDAGACSITKTINITKPLPKWEEVSP